MLREKKLNTLGLLVLILMLSTLILSACGQPQADAPAPEVEAPEAEAEEVVEEAEEMDEEATDDTAEALRLGYVYLTLEHPYYQAHSSHAQAYADELGIELVEYDGEIDAAVMANAMEDLIAQEVDGIVFALLDPAAAVPSILDAQDAGIPVVTFAIKHDAEGVSTSFVGIPEGVATEAAGEIAAKRFAEQFGEGTQAYVATVECPATQAVVDRADGFVKGFTAVMPEAEVVARVDGECVRDKALAATEDLLQVNPEVNVIYGGNGDSALGALAALQGAGRGTVDDVLLVSHDGTEPEVIELVNPNSGLKLSVANTPRQLAQTTIDVVLEMVNGERAIDSPDDVMVPAEVLTPDDVDYLQAFLADQYLSTIELTVEEPAEEMPAAEGLRLGYIYLTLEHPYYQAHSSHAQAYADDLGIELVEYDGEIDAAVMANAMEDLIAQEVDGIVFALLDPAAAVPSILDAQAAGIPVATFAIKHDAEGVSTPFVGIPEGVATEEAGKIAAERFVEQFGEDTQAYVATVECPATQAVVDRADGFVKGFTAVMPEAEVVARVDGECVRDKALAATEDLLQVNPEVNVIYGGNGDSALGALAALQGAGRGTVDDVLLVSHDGTEPEVIELVNSQSGLKLSVANTPRQLAQTTIDVVLEMIYGERAIDSPDDVMVPAEVLTPDDVDYLQEFLADQYLSTIDLSEYVK